MEFSAQELKARRERMGISQAEIADRLGISMRQYQKYEAGTVKPKLSHIKAIESELYSEGELNSSNRIIQDNEKETLKDLVETQKSLIKYQNEFITAQLIRNEAFESVILARMAEIEIATVPSRKNSTLDAVLDEAESDVKEKIQEIRRRLRLPS